MANGRTSCYLGPMDRVDLRSDTVTQPTAAMREAMARAAVGDDVYGEDPTVNALEERMATLLGHEAALFCPSGTMANQIAIRAHTRPGDEVICDEGAHIYWYEGGGIMANSQCSVRLVHGERGRFTAQQVEPLINAPGDIHRPTTKLVCIENTCNRGGGAIWEAGAIEAIGKLCAKHGLALHLDGARLFNALAVTGEAPSGHGSRFHSVSVCLSKGLGAPVGSVLAGSQAFIHQARRIRKRLGGGMRQAGILAAAGIHALDHHLARLPEDHRRARAIGQVLQRSPLIKEVLPVQTNIVMAHLRPGLDATEFAHRLSGNRILINPMGRDQIRLVTHLNVDDTAIDHLDEALKRIN